MNKTRRLFGQLLAVAAITMLGLGATCAQDKTIRIGFQKYGKLVVLKGKGTLEAKLKPLGYNVVWTEFPSGPPLLEAMNVGAIDFGIAGETPPIFAQAAGAPLVYLAYDPPAPQGEAILIPKDSPLKSVTDLKGKKVALNKGSNVHYLLVRALEKAGLRYTDIEPVFLAPADALAAFTRGAVDAWVIWDPYEAAAQASTGARILADGTGLVPNYQFYFSTKSFLQGNGKAVDGVIDALNEADDWAKNNIQAVAEQLSPSIGLTPAVLAVSLQRESYGIKPIADDVIASQQRIADTFFALGLLPKQIIVSDLAKKVRLMTAAAAPNANLLWFLPTHGDGRYLGTTVGGRPVTLSYLKQIAQAADQLGYSGVLLPTGRSCEDSWIVAAALAPLTERLKFLVAVRPGLQSPSVAARMTATLDRISDGRLLINVVTGGDPVENKGDGIFLSHDERYEVTREFLTVYRALLAGQTVNFKGKHITVEDGRLLFLPTQPSGPPLYFGGSSDAGVDVAVDTVDKYLTWGEPPAQVADKINRVAAIAAQRGRKVSFGIRLHVIVRETNAAAWQAADELIQYVSDETIASAQQIFARMDSVGQQRMAQLHGGRRDKLEISPNLWAGVGLVRGGAGTALVGDAETVAARIREYQAIGIDTFIMSGYPHLEEAYRFAELVFPLLSREHGGNVTPLRVNTGPFGETIAGEYRPLQKQAS